MTQFLSIQPMLKVKSIKEALGLYEKMGFQLIYEQKDTHAVMGKGAVQLHLTAIEQKPACQIIVNQVDEVYHMAKKAGVKVIYPIGNRPWGNRDFTLEDLDGNQLTFSQKI